MYESIRLKKIDVMKKISFLPLILMLSVVAVGLTGCELIGDIFKAGIWVGIILVVGIIALVLFLIRKIF